MRFGGPVLSARTQVVLFRRAAEVTPAPGAGYAAAATLIELSCAVALADGHLADAERAVIEQQVIGRPGLSEDERRRLRALITRVAAAPPAAASLRKHVSQLPAGLRADAGELLLAVAHADGRVDRAEVTRVNRYFDALGLDRPQLGSPPGPPAPEDLTRLRAAGTPSPGYTIPQAPPAEQPAAAPVALDPELVRARLAETERAASILAGIFTGDDTSSFTALRTPSGPPGQTAGAPGLDAAHRAFLEKLAERPSWARSEVAAVAAGLGLMPDGAMEIVNEAAFDAAGEPACEGSDPVEINTDVAKEILR